MPKKAKNTFRQAKEPKLKPRIKTVLKELRCLKEQKSYYRSSLVFMAMFLTGFMCFVAGYIIGKC